MLAGCFVKGSASRRLEYESSITWRFVLGLQNARHQTQKSGWDILEGLAGNLHSLAEDSLAEEQHSLAGDHSLVEGGHN